MKTEIKVKGYRIEIYSFENDSVFAFRILNESGEFEDADCVAYGFKNIDRMFEYIPEKYGITDEQIKSIKSLVNGEVK